MSLLNVPCQHTQRTFGCINCLTFFWQQLPQPNDSSSRRSEQHNHQEELLLSSCVIHLLELQLVFKFPEAAKRPQTTIPPPSEIPVGTMTLAVCAVFPSAYSVACSCQTPLVSSVSWMCLQWCCRISWCSLVSFKCAAMFRGHGRLPQ